MRPTSNAALAVLVIGCGLLGLVGFWAVAADQTWRLLANTTLLVGGTCLIGLPVGTITAILLARTDLPGRRWFAAMLVVMLFVPLYLQAAGWDAGFGRQGWFSFSQGRLAAPPLQGWTAAIWIHGFAGIPWTILIVGTALRYVAREYEELALLDAPMSVVIWGVTLRRCLPAMGVAAAWLVVLTAGEMTVTDLYQVRTFAEQVYKIAQYQGLAALSGQWRSLSLMVTSLLLLTGWLLIRFAPVARAAPTRPAAPYALGRATLLALAFVLLLIGVLVAVPLGNLAYNAGFAAELVDGQLVRSWDFGKFVSITGRAGRRFAEEFGWTFLLSGVSATAALLVAVPLVWSAVRRYLVGGIVVATTAACLVTPGPLVGLGIIWLLNRDSELLFALYSRSILPPCMAMFVRAFPITVLVTWFALRSISADTLEAAATEGAGSLRRLLRVAAPQRVAGLLTAWIAALAVAMGDLAATILVTPPGVTTVARRVFGMLHAGVDDQVAGICLTMFGLCFLLAVAAILMWQAVFRSQAGDRGL